MSNLNPTTLAAVTSEVVAAYVAKNHLQPSELSALIASVHATFNSLCRSPVPEVAAEPLKPAVPIRKSITDEYLLSLEDGRPYRTLKWHLAKYNLTPTRYRAKWGLPADYPMVAPAYAAERLKLAKTLGLGRKRQEEAVERL